jgi:hypothetical protein
MSWDVAASFGRVNRPSDILSPNGDQRCRDFLRDDLGPLDFLTQEFGGR